MFSSVLRCSWTKWNLNYFEHQPLGAMSEQFCLLMQFLVCFEKQFCLTISRQTLIKQSLLENLTSFQALKTFLVLPSNFTTLLKFIQISGLVLQLRECACCSHELRKKWLKNWVEKANSAASAEKKGKLNHISHCSWK